MPSKAFIGGTFEKVVHDPAFVEATRGTGRVVHLIQSDPAAETIIDFEAQKVHTAGAADGVPSNVTLRMSSDNSNRFWQGKLNFTLAMAQRKVKLEGKRSVALKLLPFVPLFASYVQTLKDAGREDLLV